MSPMAKVSPDSELSRHDPLHAYGKPVLVASAVAAPDNTTIAEMA